MAEEGKIQLILHEDETFTSQTVYLSGHAYVNCTFARCTVVVTNTVFMARNCRFLSCNWHIDYDILWGEPETRSRLRRLLDFIDGASDATG